MTQIDPAPERPVISRRDVLRGATTGLFVSGILGALAGCGGGSSPTTQETSTSTGPTSASAASKLATSGAPGPAAQLPTYRAYAGVQPDLPGSANGIRPGFLRYPQQRPRSVADTPANGQPLQATVTMYQPLPAGPTKNKYWQAVDDRLGTQLNMDMVPASEYAQRLTTILAGNDVPDFVQIYGIPHLPDVLEKLFADLTEFLAGDAVNDYPNLANIPTAAWKVCSHNGAIRGIPVPRAAIGSPTFLRMDIVEKAGFSARPKDFDEFHEMAKAVTDPKHHRWAFSYATYPILVARAMLRAPNVWRDEDGKLTNVFETEEARKALDVAAQFWKEGLVHPDAFSANPPYLEWFISGTTVIQPDGYVSWAYYRQNSVDVDGFALDFMRIPGYDGGAGAVPAGSPTFQNGLTAFKKADKDRLREQLRVANWLAAPFGTDEYHLRTYGLPDIHHTIDKNGDPQLTKVGLSEITVPFKYITESPSVIYQPAYPHDAELQHSYEEDVMPHAVHNPTLGLYSDTDATKGATLNSNLTNVQNDVIQGRKSLTDWDDAVVQWRRNGGDKIREEYEKQLPASGGS
jgi:putative aldouronate transport system substrate-binding protein